ncbi:MAG: HPr kinase/phosphorylase [Bacteroidetes bacterium]|nr:HPr kinase/phosphorylase [Bacteroidota bacterium]
MEEIIYKTENGNTRVIEKMIVSKFFEDLKHRMDFELLCSKGLDQRYFNQRDLHRPGLALAGFVKLFTHEKIQILGNTENYYLLSLSEEGRRSAFNKVFEFPIPCIIVTNGNTVFPEMLELCKEKNIPLAVTGLNTTDAIHLISGYLDEMFAPEISVHGSMVDVYGIGMLFTGKSGIGKSEIALDLIERGHRLVADDTVKINRIAENILVARGHSNLKHFMEIRGVGILDVREMFGIRAVRVQKRLEVQVDLQLWDGKEEYERLGLDEQLTGILDVKIPLIRLPIYPGKNITVIAEAIALNQLLKIYGYDAAKEFSEKLTKEIQNKQALSTKVVDTYLERDFE